MIRVSVFVICHNILYGILTFVEEDTKVEAVPTPSRKLSNNAALKLAIHSIQVSKLQFTFWQSTQV